MEEAAVRECAEETGIKCFGLRTLINFQPGLDTYNNPTRVFYTREFAVLPGYSPSADEVVECHWVPLDECVKMTFDGKIADSMSILSILAYHALVSQRR